MLPFIAYTEKMTTTQKHMVEWAHRVFESLDYQVNPMTPSIVTMVIQTRENMWYYAGMLLTAEEYNAPIHVKFALAYRILEYIGILPEIPDAEYVPDTYCKFHARLYRILGGSGDDCHMPDVDVARGHRRMCLIFYKLHKKRRMLWFHRCIYAAYAVTTNLPRTLTVKLE